MPSTHGTVVSSPTRPASRVSVKTQGPLADVGELVGDHRVLTRRVEGELDEPALGRLEVEGLAGPVLLRSSESRLHGGQGLWSRSGRQTPRLSLLAEVGQGRGLGVGCGERGCDGRPAGEGHELADGLTQLLVVHWTQRGALAVVRRSRVIPPKIPELPEEVAGQAGLLPHKLHVSVPGL